MVANAALHEKYVEALLGELGSLAAGISVDTAYIGGGTPTCLAPELLLEVLSSVQKLGFRSQGELTVEANPGTVDSGYLRLLRQSGVTRLSLGVQSLSDTELGLLGRIHTAVEARKAVALAREAGFDSVNLDLMYGLPGQSVTEWESTIIGAIGLEPDHLSLYALTLEEGTPLEQSVRSGALPAPDTDVAAEMYELAEGLLASEGYDHYELSNWARKPSRRCKHNLKYWTLAPYVGVGAAAHSFVGGWRWWNVSDPDEYIRRVSSGDWASRDGAIRIPRLAMDGETEVQFEVAAGEALFLGLRLVDGVSRAEYHSRFGVPPDDLYGPRIARLVTLGLLEDDGQRLRLSARGRLLGNQVFVEFVGPPDRAPGGN